MNEVLGGLSFDMLTEARNAIKNGGDFSIMSPYFRKKNGIPDDVGILRGKEIRDWGLDLDTLLTPEPEKGTVEYQRKRII